MVESYHENCLFPLEEDSEKFYSNGSKRVLLGS